MVRFSASPKNEPHSPPSREQSERKRYQNHSVFVKKRLILVMPTPQLATLTSDARGASF
ncbi:MAG: hypothetical protein U5L45_20295 [Saprospiraceae bacterium]|nr:hypothetical protein [Saprospiraceae bacterium]